MQPSSLEAYQRILLHIQIRHQAILSWMIQHYPTAVMPPPWTHHEMKQLMLQSGTNIPEVWKRLREMERLGLIRCLPKAPCRVHEGEALRWELLPTPPTPEGLRRQRVLASNGNRQRLQSLLDSTRGGLARLRQDMLDARADGRWLTRVSNLLAEIDRRGGTSCPTS